MRCCRVRARAVPVIPAALALPCCYVCYPAARVLIHATRLVAYFVEERQRGYEVRKGAGQGWEL